MTHSWRVPGWRSLALFVVSIAIAASCTSGEVDVSGGPTTTTTSTTTAPVPEATVDEQTAETSAVPTITTETVPDETASSSTVPQIDRPLENPVTVLAVSDLTDCRGPDAEVAELVRSLDGIIAMPGDLANREGSRQQFEDCFLPQYGSEFDRLYATPGDNDYNTPGAEPYFETMTNLPGEAGKGWYAVEIGSWQLISLNSNCDQVGGCRQGSEQYEWLDQLLKDTDYECRVAMWHEPRFTSSANYGGIPRLADFYGRLHGAGADIILVGHSHHYERLGPLAPNGDPSPDGMMNFTLGVGGSTFTQFGDPRPGSQVRSNEHRGLVRFTLGDGGYDWEFINVESNETDLVDTGSADC